ncbi:MAG: recombinase family protein [Acidobacteriota bacterium]
MLRAVIYVRVSSADQVEGYSLDTQEDACRAYCHRRHLEIVQVFREEGVSARTLDRPALKKLLKLCNGKDRPDVVVVYDVSRMGRQLLDWLWLRKHLSDLGVRLDSATERFTEGAAGDLHRNMLAVFAEYDNAQRAEKCTLGMQKAAELGRWVWKAPYGYRCGGKQATSLVVEPQEAEVVARIYEWMATGLHRQSGIRDELNRKGIRRPNGRPFDNQTINRVLSKPVYYGRLRCNSWGVDRVGDWAPIVTADVWHRAQSERDVRKPASAKPKPQRNPDFPLRGVIREAVTGEVLSASWSRGKLGKRYGYYHTVSAKPSIRANRDKVHAAFMDLLATLKPRPGLVRIWREMVIRVWQRKHDEVAAEHRRLQAEVARLEDQKKALARARFIDKELDAGTYKSLAEEMDRDLLVARMASSEAQFDDIDIEATLSYAEHLITKADRIWDESTVEQQQRFAGLLFPNGLVWESGGFRTPETMRLFGLFREAEGGSPRWLGDRDSNPD